MRELIRFGEVAALLLNPYVLWDLADLINTLMPPSWLDLMTAVGRELIERYRLEIRILGEHDLAPSAPLESARGPPSVGN